MAVDRVSFALDKGEIVGFLGPNGAGKTTTMRILTTYLPATSGIAKVAGFDVMTESMEVRRKIGYLPESVPLYGEMRVEEYLAYRAKLKGLTRKDLQKRLDYCLERCRIREVRRRLVGTLSKGYRQRVGLADAMIHDPPILIMDEPTAGLDPIQIRQTLALIQELGEEHTILLSTHILSEVEAVCERVIIINYGRVNVEKSLEELEAEDLIVLEVRGPVAEITKLLKGIPGVTEVEASEVEDGLCRFEVQAEGEDDPREKMSLALGKRGFAVRRLERKRRRLEDAFFDVIRAQDPLKEAITSKAPTVADDDEEEEEEGEDNLDEHVQDLQRKQAAEEEEEQDESEEESGEEEESEEEKPKGKKK
jgi:ABC-2 type transport system ATP-binding protein